MKLALVTIVTANLEQMRTFYQEVLQIEPQTYRGNYVEFALEAGTLALWRQSECEAFGLAPMRGAANHSVLIELEVEDVDEGVRPAERSAAGVGSRADDPAVGPSRLLRP